jgi:hemerythrin-like domain-containing protein
MPCHDHLPPVDLTRPSAVSILSGEHRVILQVITCLERISDQTGRDQRIPAAHARQAIEVIRTFADRCHHGKEEDILFPALEAQVPGFGPTAVMREEHVLGRRYVAAMDGAVEADDVAGFTAAATGYCGLLRAHIAKEDDILFRIAQTMLSPAQDAAILDAYRAVEHDDMGDGTHERLLGIADALADAYGVPRASDDPQTFALLTAVCGCHITKA